MKYNLYTYDLLGNDEDGFTVNDVHINTANIELDDCDLETDKTLFTALMRRELIRESVNPNNLDIDWQEDCNGKFVIYINYDGKPACELRPIY